MVVSQGNRQWLRGLFQVQGSVIPGIFPRVLFCAIFSSFIAWFYTLGWPVSHPTIAGIVPTLVLGLLLVFRTNTAYDRYWEGRKVWGTILNLSRSIGIQIWSFVKQKTDVDALEKKAILRVLSAFAYATKLHLRNEPINQDVEALVTPAQYETLRTVDNAPLEIAGWIARYLDHQHSQGMLEGSQMRTIVELLSDLVNCIGATERILKTPLPAAYAIHLKQLLLIYCLSLPFQLVAELGWLTGLVVGLISFTLLGIEEIGLEIENPFGHDPNDLPLDTICQTIQRNIEELSRSHPQG